MNRAKLAYNSVAAWLDGKGAAPARVAAVAGMDQQLRIQDGVAQRAEARAPGSRGRSDSRRSRPRPCSRGPQLVDLQPDEDNRAKELIEYFMIAANGVVARYLESKGSPVAAARAAPAGALGPHRGAGAAAAASGCRPTPDGRALSAFLIRRRQAAPAQFPDLSLAIVKLLGAGEYVLKRPGQTAEGHFGLARERLHACDGAQPALPGRHHAAADEGSPERRGRAVQR